MKHYKIWDKKTDIITPSGKIFTPEQWIEQFPVAGLPNVTVLCSPGEINGAIFATLNSVKDQYMMAGCDFSDCATPEEVLARIDDFEDKQAAIMENTVYPPTVEERIAAALEAQVIMSMPDQEGV